MKFTSRQVTASPFRFAQNNPNATSLEKYKGLSRFGPYQLLASATPPRIGFVFPNQLVEDARNLYTALRSGIGLFKGCASLFQFDVAKDNVFRITNFDLPTSTRATDHARCYADAIIEWTTTSHEPADIFVVLHAKSARWEEDTPYYLCKAHLLKHGIVSQHVTPELLRNPKQFEWSAAEIALQMFVKLGGIPWVIQSTSGRPDVVIGVGRVERQDEQGGLRRLMGFTACVRADGPFLFSQLGAVAEWGPQYLAGLTSAVRETLTRCSALPERPQMLVVHMSKDFGREEENAINKGVEEATGDQAAFTVAVLKVTSDEHLFAVDSSVPGGVPPRGCRIRIGDRDFLIYTEGREDARAWQTRTPTAIRVRLFTSHPDAVREELLRQIYDLAQVNYRGFRSTSEPASMKYSRLMTHILSHLPPTELASIAANHDSVLSQRMWFL